MTKLPENHTGYNYGHPWYYLLGGKVLTPKQIRADAATHDYHGYMADRIKAIANNPEPQRSEKLCQIREDVKRELKNDLSRYREVALILHRFRASDECDISKPDCKDFHTGMSLKYAHIYNCFGHLALLETFPLQGDLFDF